MDRWTDMFRKIDKWLNNVNTILSASGQMCILQTCQQ